MTNLLPPQAKKQIVLEYWVRTICVWVIVWSASLVLGTLLLLPTYVLLSSTSDAYDTSATAATERNEEYKILGRTLRDATSQAKQIFDDTKRPQLSVVMNDIFAIERTVGVEVSGITVGQNEDGLMPVSISGVASNRQALASFRADVQALEYITGVNLPINNLAQNQNIQFSITALVPEPEEEDKDKDASG